MKRRHYLSIFSGALFIAVVTMTVSTNWTKNPGNCKFNSCGIWEQLVDNSISNIFFLARMRRPDIVNIHMYTLARSLDSPYSSANRDGYITPTTTINKEGKDYSLKSIFELNSAGAASGVNTKINNYFESNPSGKKVVSFPGRNWIKPKKNIIRKRSLFRLYACIKENQSDWKDLYGYNTSILGINHNVLGFVMDYHLAESNPGKMFMREEARKRVCKRAIRGARAKKYCKASFDAFSIFSSRSTDGDLSHQHIKRQDLRMRIIAHEMGHLFRLDEFSDICKGETPWPIMTQPQEFDDDSPFDTKEGWNYSFSNINAGILTTLQSPAGSGKWPGVVCEDDNCFYNCRGIIRGDEEDKLATSLMLSALEIKFPDERETYEYGEPLYIEAKIPINTEYEASYLKLNLDLYLNRNFKIDILLRNKSNGVVEIFQPSDFLRDPYTSKSTESGEVSLNLRLPIFSNNEKWVLEPTKQFEPTEFEVKVTISDRTGEELVSKELYFSLNRPNEFSRNLTKIRLYHDISLGNYIELYKDAEGADEYPDVRMDFEKLKEIVLKADKDDLVSKYAIQVIAELGTLDGDNFCISPQESKSRLLETAKFIKSLEEDKYAPSLRTPWSNLLPIQLEDYSLNLQHLLSNTE